jgi:signal transduction histidine kinase
MTFDSKEAKEIVFLSNKLLDMNKRLIESEKAKSRFLSLVANELNNPMTALLGLIPHLKPDHPEENDIFSLAHQEALLLNFVSKISWRRPKWRVENSR